MTLRAGQGRRRTPAEQRGIDRTALRAADLSRLAPKAVLYVHLHQAALHGADTDGLAFLVDHRGTRRIPREHARMILDAPPGVDIYPGTRIELT